MVKRFIWTFFLLFLHTIYCTAHTAILNYILVFALQSLGNWKMKMRRKSTTKTIDDDESTEDEVSKPTKTFESMIRTNRIRNMYPYNDDFVDEQPKKKTEEVINKDEIPDWDGGFEKKEEKKVWKPKVPFQPNKTEEKKPTVSSYGTKSASPKILPKISSRDNISRENSQNSSIDCSPKKDTFTKSLTEFSESTSMKNDVPINSSKNDIYNKEPLSSPKNGHKAPTIARGRGNVSAKGKFFEDKFKELSSPSPVQPRFVEVSPHKFPVEKQTPDEEPRLYRRGSPDSGIDGGANFGGSSTPGSVKITDDYVDLSETNMAELKRSKLNSSPKNGAGERLFHEKNIRINLNGITTKKFGFAIRGGKEDNQPIFIGKVQMGSAADINELEEGDELIAVNNRNVADRYRNSIENLLSSIESENSSSVTLTIRRSISKGLFNPVYFIKFLKLLTIRRRNVCVLRFG